MRLQRQAVVDRRDPALVGEPAALAVADGDQRDVAVDASSSSGMPGASRRPWRVVITGVAQCAANRNEWFSMWAWTMSKRWASRHAIAIVCCM